MSPGTCSCADSSRSLLLCHLRDSGEQRGTDPLLVVRLAVFEQQSLVQSWEELPGRSLPPIFQIPSHNKVPSSLQHDLSPLQQPPCSCPLTVTVTLPISPTWVMIWALCAQKGPFVHDFRPRLLTLVKVCSTSEPSPGKTNMKCFNRIAKFTLKTIKYRYSCRSWLLITTEKEADTLILVPASGQTGGIT